MAKLSIVLPKINLVKVKAYVPFILLGLLIMVEVVVVTFYLPRKVFGLLEIRDRLTELTRVVKELSAAEESLSQVNQEQLTAELVKAETALPDDKRVAGVISGLGGLASSSGVLAKSIDFVPGRVSTGSGNLGTTNSEGIAVGEKVKAIPVSMVVTSSLDQFLSYLNKLQTSRQLLGVTGINYSLSGNTPGGSLSLLVYYLPGRSGRPSWQFIPIVSAQELKMISDLSGPDIFNLQRE